MQNLTGPVGTSNNEISEEADSSDFEYVLYMYETPETGLFDSMTVIDGLELASIKSLEKELFEQYGFIIFNDNNELLPESRLKRLIGKSIHEWIICKEGVFGWDDRDHEYKYYGQPNDRKTERVKRIEVFEDRVFLKENQLSIIEKGHYDVINEELKVINSDVNILMITIKQSESGEHITMPCISGIFNVYEADKALIDYTDEYKKMFNK